MRRKRARESGNQADCALSQPAFIAAVFLGVHILPLFWRPEALWGVDFLVYLPTPAQGAFILLFILLFIPGFRLQVRGWVSYLPLAIWGKGPRVWITRGSVILTALVAFIAFSSARHFLGDGYHVLEKLDAEDWHDRYRAPLTYALIGTLHRLGSDLWATAENTYRVYSYVSGTLYVLLSFPVAAALGKNGLERSILLAFLLTAGFHPAILRLRGELRPVPARPASLPLSGSAYPGKPNVPRCTRPNARHAVRIPSSSHDLCAVPILPGLP